MLSYETLRIIWWLLLGVLLSGFAIMDGFDIGIAALLPFVARTDLERRVTLNTIGPVWEGNQVWIILGAGAIFAAWPSIYSVSFSGFYLAMFLVLLTFIVRPVAFKYRSKLQYTAWRSVWDWSLSIAGFVAALIFGVALGNVLQGVPFHFDESLRAFYTGSFFSLLNPFALLCGLVSICMLLMQGGLFLAVKTEDIINKRAIASSRLAALLFLVLFILAGILIKFEVSGYVVNQALDPNGPSNPLYKTVITQTGAWLINYNLHPWLWLAPGISIGCAFLIALFAKQLPNKLSFLMSCSSVLGVIFTVGFCMFPFILPSSSNPQESLLVWDASSSQLTLMIMLVSTIIFLPIILLYTSWVYRVLRGKMTADYVRENNKSVY